MENVDGSYAVLSRLLNDRRRYLRHAVFVGVIFLFWTLYSLRRLHGWEDWLRMSLFASTYVVIAYLNIYRFFRYIVQGRLALYAGCTALSFVISYLAQNLVYFSTWEQLRSDLTPSWALAVDMMINALTYFMFIGMGLSVRLIRMWLVGERRIYTLEQENLRSRLSGLRSQVSPHFLFNTFNNLHVLTKTDPALASEMVLGFADLMRYQLNECEKDKVALEMEIGYIENFLALERLRKSRLDVRVDYDRRDVQGLQIEPLLFTSLVENAVKHGSQQMEDGFVHVRISRTEELFVFQVRNSRPGVPRIGREGSLGHGIDNLRKRLSLSYPGRHALHLVPDKCTFTAKLELRLS